MSDVKRGLRSIWIIFIDEFLESLKTKKALAIIMSYIFLMFVGIKIGSLFEVFAWAFAGSRQSFSILLPYYISVGLLPLFAIIINYNVISEEISSGSIKFMSYRTDRLSILSGKVLSSFALATIMIFVAYLLALFYIYAKVGLWFFLGYAISWIFLSIYALCFICLTTFISTITKTPSSSITWAMLVSVVFLVLLNFDYVKFLSPFFFSPNGLDFIIKGILIDMLLGVCILLLHAFAYYIVSYALLKKSDLA